MERTRTPDTAGHEPAHEGAADVAASLPALGEVRAPHRGAELRSEGPSTCAACGLQEAFELCTHCGCARFAGAYRIESVLAQSERGRVYLARDPAGLPVALKELVFATVPGHQQLEQFRREARVLAQLDHPCIPGFVAAFETGTGVHTRLFLAQEFVEGESLLQRLAAHRFDEEEAREIAAQVLRIVAYLHGRSPRIIHRDLKPGNLIRRPDGQVALVDFDAARDLRAQRTHGASLAGTFGYMPIEQLGGTVDASSDLFALGATLIHLLSGSPPHELLGPDLQLRFADRIQVGPAFAGWLSRLVARDPAARFPTAEAATAALRSSQIAPVAAAREVAPVAAEGAPDKRAAALALVAMQTEARASRQRARLLQRLAKGAALALLLGVAGALGWQALHRPRATFAARPPGQAAPVRPLGTVEFWTGSARGPILVDEERIERSNAYVRLDSARPVRQVTLGDPGVTFLLESDGTGATLSVVRLPEGAQLTVDSTPVSRKDRIPFDKRVVLRTVTGDKKGPMMQARFYAPGEPTGPWPR